MEIKANHQTKIMIIMEKETILQIELEGKNIKQNRCKSKKKSRIQYSILWNVYIETTTKNEECESDSPILFKNKFFENQFFKTELFENHFFNVNFSTQLIE